MKIDDAMLVLHLLEKHYDTADLSILSKRSPLRRKYTVCLDLEAAELRDLNLMREVTEELDQCEIEHRIRVVGRDGGVTVKIEGPDASAA